MNPNKPPAASPQHEECLRSGPPHQLLYLPFFSDPSLNTTFNGNTPAFPEVAIFHLWTVVFFSCFIYYLRPTQTGRCVQVRSPEDTAVRSSASNFPSRQNKRPCSIFLMWNYYESDVTNCCNKDFFPPVRRVKNTHEVKGGEITLVIMSSAELGGSRDQNRSQVHQPLPPRPHGWILVAFKAD